MVMMLLNMSLPLMNMPLSRLMVKTIITLMTPMGKPPLANTRLLVMLPMRHRNTPWSTGRSIGCGPSFHALKKSAAPGGEGVTWREYQEGWEDRRADRKDRIHRGAYRAPPSRRIYRPKAAAPATPDRDRGPGRRGGCLVSETGQPHGTPAADRRRIDVGLFLLGF